MRLSDKQLLLVCNPFCAPLAADGRATAICAVDPEEPMGTQYIGARTLAKPKAWSAQDRRRAFLPYGPRDKVSVSYKLEPVRVADTSYYRAKVKSGEVFEAGETFAAALRSAARSALAVFVAGGGDRAAALAAWRTQGLAAVADMLEQRTSGKLPPASDVMHEAGPRPFDPPGVAIEGVPGETVTLDTTGEA